MAEILAPSPLGFREVLIDSGGSQIRFDREPVLAEHITVPPHVAVTTAKHSYSFSESGADLCFHSPEALPEGSANLATFLAKLSAGFLERGEVLSPETAGQALNDLIGAVYERPASDAEILGEDPIGRWLAWGDRLRQQEGIEQYALVQWDKILGALF